MEQWIDNIRRQAQDYGRKSPDGLLDDIKQAMDALPRVPKAPLRIVWGRRIAVAASVAIAVLAVWRLSDDSTTKPYRHNVKGTVAQTNAPTTTDQPARIPTYYDTASDGIGEWIRHIAASTRDKALAYIPQSEIAIIQEPANEPVTEAEARRDSPTAPPDSQRKDNHSANPAHNRDWWATTSQHHTYSHNAIRRVDISVAYSGMGATSSNGSMALLASDSKMYNDEGGLTMAAADMTTHAHHYTPVKLGLNIRYNINSHWSVQAGATYSRLTSDITRSNNIEEYRSHQRLHYVGATLSASYSLWRTKNVNVYLSAGGEAAKLASGTAAVSHTYGGQRMDDYDENIHEHHLQYSVSGAAGIEYNAGKRISLFAEPGVTRYFDNHSTVTNIYKDKPTQFTLNVGLRINLGK